MSRATESLESPFLARWILFTTFACIIALPIAFITAHFLGGDFTMVAFYGAVVAFAQWFMLSKRITLSGWWVLAGTVGLGVPGLIGAILSTTGLLPAIVHGTGGKILGLATLGVLGGLLSGLLQMPMLKPHFAKAPWWILASTIGWGLCLLAGASIDGLITLVGSSIAGSSNLVVGLATGVTAFVGGLLFSFPLGIVTGAGLLWIAKRPAQHVTPGVNLSNTTPSGHVG